MTMKIHPLSDLHLEFSKKRTMPGYTPPECDVVVLAGDVSTGVSGVMWAQDTFDVPVIYVPGNHEFYGKREYHGHIEKMKAKAEGSKVHVLTADSHSIDGVTFLGVTLWTDFDLYGKAPISQVVAQTEMNDYQSILLKKWPIQPLTAESTRRLHLEAKYWLNEELRLKDNSKTVVVTHHAPSELSIHERYRNDELTPAYASRLEGLICEHSPALWIHGHLHDSVDYTLCDTRVICNPRGYVGHHLNPGFDPTLVIEL